MEIKDRISVGGFDGKIIGLKSWVCRCGGYFTAIFNYELAPPPAINIVMITRNEWETLGTSGTDKRK